MKTLKGAPREVGYLNCRWCIKLESLKDGPEKVRNTVKCGYYPNLEITDEDRDKYEIYLGGEFERS